MRFTALLVRIGINTSVPTNHRWGIHEELQDLGVSHTNWTSTWFVSCFCLLKLLFLDRALELLISSLSIHSKTRLHYRATQFLISQNLCSFKWSPISHLHVRGDRVCLCENLELSTLIIISLLHLVSLVWERKTQRAYTHPTHTRLVSLNLNTEVQINRYHTGNIPIIQQLAAIYSRG